MAESTPAAPARPAVALAPRQKAARDFSEYLTARKDFIAKQISDPELDAERVIAGALAYIAADERLWGCTKESVYDAIIRATKANLVVGPEGDAWIVSYKDQAQFQLGYRGALKLMRRSGSYSLVTAFLVHQKEIPRLRIRQGTDARFEFDPIVLGDKGPVAGYCVFAKMPNGEFDYELMSVDDVNKIRAISKSYQSNPSNSPWTAWPDRMGLKTAIHRFSKRAEMNPVDRRVMLDDEEEEFRAAKDVTPSRASLPSTDQSGAIPASATDRLKAEIRAQAPAEAAPPHDVVTGEVVAEPPAEKRTRAKKDEKPAADAAKPPEKKQPAPGDGFAEASKIIEAVAAVETRAEVSEWQETLNGALDAGRIGSMHAARANEAIKAAFVRVDGGGK